MLECYLKIRKILTIYYLRIQFLDHIYYSHTNTHLSDLKENIQSEEIQPTQQALPIRQPRRSLKIPKQPNELLETDFEEIQQIQQALPIQQPIIPPPPQIPQLSHSSSSNEVAQNQADLSQIRRRNLLDLLCDI